MFDQYSAKAAREADLASYYAQKAQESAAKAETYQGSVAGESGYDANVMTPKDLLKGLQDNTLGVVTELLNGDVVGRILDLMDSLFTGSVGSDSSKTVQQKAKRLLLMSAGLRNVSMQMLLTQNNPRKENVPYWFGRGILGELIAQGAEQELISTVKEKLSGILGKKNAE